MYRPQYLNVERNKETIYVGNAPYYSINKVTSLGFKGKSNKRVKNKSCMRFIGKCGG